MEGLFRHSPNSTLILERVIYPFFNVQQHWCFVRVIIVLTKINIMGVSPQTCKPQSAILPTWISLHIDIYSVPLPTTLLSRGYLLLLLLGYLPSPATLLGCIAPQCHLFLSEYICRWLVPLCTLRLKKCMLRSQNLNFELRYLNLQWLRCTLASVALGITPNVIDIRRRRCDVVDVYIFFQIIVVGAVVFIRRGMWHGRLEPGRCCRVRHWTPSPLPNARFCCWVFSLANKTNSQLSAQPRVYKQRNGSMFNWTYVA